MRLIFRYLTRIHASIRIYQTTLPRPLPVRELSNVYLIIQLVFLVGTPVLMTFKPFSLVILFWWIVYTCAMLHIVVPVPWIIGSSIVKIVCANSLFAVLVEEPIIDFPRFEHINSLSMKLVIFPASEIDISRRIGEDSLSLFEIIDDLS